MSGQQQRSSRSVSKDTSSKSAASSARSAGGADSADQSNSLAQDQLASDQASERSTRAADGDKGRVAGSFELLGQRFATLQAVHDWVEAQKQDPTSTVPHEPVLKVSLTPDSIIHERQQTLWTTYSPDQRLVIEGNGAVVSGLKGGRPTPGFFLSYRPNVGAGTTEAAPAAANFTMSGVTVRGYESGGVEISPQTQSGSDHKWDGGVSAFLSGAVIDHNRFEDLGSLHSKPGAADWSKQRYGVGGVLARGLQGSQITDNVFDGLENGDVKGTSTGPRLIHGVYLRDHSSNNTVSGNRFKDISGDSVRVSNASNDNQITDNRSRNAGLRTLVSEFWNPTAGEADSHGNRVTDNNIGDVYGPSQKKAKRFLETKSTAKRPALAD